MLISSSNNFRAKVGLTERAASCAFVTKPHIHRLSAQKLLQKKKKKQLPEIPSLFILIQAQLSLLPLTATWIFLVF